MTLRNWDKVQANVKELSLFEALHIRAFIINEKVHENNEVMSTLIKDLDTHIFNIGRENYVEENCS